jgi:broad specificity phosphatase PhoE
MGTLTLLNDIQTDMDFNLLMVGDLDLQPDKSSLKTFGKTIADGVCSKNPGIEVIYSSDAIRIKTLVHKIRIQSKDQVLTKLDNRNLEALRERSFGVLNGTPLQLTSDVFSSTRIKPDNGESVFDCRVRAMKCINGICKKHPGKNILVVSHPFLCQIAFNAMLQKDHTYLTPLWIEMKGSFASFKFNVMEHGIQWEFLSAYNTIINTAYTQDEIYSRLLGKERPFTS